MRYWLLLVLLLAGAVAWFAWPVDDEGGNGPPPPPENLRIAASTFALLVGCTEYPRLDERAAPGAGGSYQLDGPANDVVLMRSVLHRYLGVPANNIQVLAGWPDDLAARPTRANILRHLDRLAREAPTGGRVFFMFAGHGCTLPDRNGDEKDGADEVLLASDADYWDADAGRMPGAIRDDEVRERLIAIRKSGATVFALLDCCHSGTGLRGTPSAEEGGDVDDDSVRSRGLSARDLGVPELDLQPDATAGTRGMGSHGGTGFLGDVDSLGGIAAIYGAQSSEKAPEMRLPRSRHAGDRSVHGLCTYCVARTLQEYGGGITLAELHAHVRDAYEMLPWEKTTPGYGGSMSMRAVPGAAPTGRALLLWREAGRLVVQAGSLGGLVEGSKLEVYKPGGFTDARALLGRVTLVEVGPLRSVCGPVDGGPDLSVFPDGAPARLVELSDGGPRLHLALFDAAGAPASPQRLRELLRASFFDSRARAGFPFVAPGEAGWHLREIATGPGEVPRFLLAPADSQRGLVPLEVSAPDLLSTLERVHRAQTLRRVSRDGRPLPKGMLVEALVQRMGSEERTLLEPGERIAPGDFVVLRLTNGTGHAVDVAVKHLDTQQRETRLWPSDEPSERYHADEKDLDELRPLFIGGGASGRESLIVVVGVRAVGASRMDTSRVLVAPHEDGHGSTEEAREETLLSDLGEELGGPVAGMRGTDDTVLESVALREFTWTTSWGRIGVPTPIVRGLVMLDPPVACTWAAGGTPPPGRPKTWTQGCIVAGDEDRADVLLLRGTDGAGDSVFGLFLDADGDGELADLDLAEAARRAGARRLPVDLLVLLGTRTDAAAYPRHKGDLMLGRVMVAPTGSDRSTHRYSLRAGAWERRTAFGAWLSTALLPDDLEADLAWPLVNALRGFCRPR